MPELTSAVRRPLTADVLVVVAWFVLVAVVGAVVWWQLTPLAEYTRTASTAQMGEEQLGVQVSADGWYFVIAAVGGLLSGVVLLSWRHRDPLASVVLVTVGALLAGWLVQRIGLWLGPADPKDVLPHVAEGAKVPLQLRVHASGLVLVWPITALLGAIGVIWGSDAGRTNVLEDPLSVQRGG
jgi:hypothetical protein